MGGASNTERGADPDSESEGLSVDDTASNTETTSPIRLQNSGVGVICGALILAAGAIVAPYDIAAALVILASVAGWVLGRKYPIHTNVFVGAVAVGAIALVEALSDLGLGLDPFALAFVAALFGIFDIIIGRLLDWFRSRRND